MYEILINMTGKDVEFNEKSGDYELIGEEKEQGHIEVVQNIDDLKESLNYILDEIKYMDRKIKYIAITDSE